MAVNNGTQNEQIDLRFAISSIAARVRKAGINEASMTALASAPVANSVYRIAVAYKVNDAVACVNGGAIAQDSAVALSTGITTLAIGNRVAGAYLNGHICRVVYFPRRLTNTELQAITG